MDLIPYIIGALAGGVSTLVICSIRFDKLERKAFNREPNPPSRSFRKVTRACSPRPMGSRIDLEDKLIARGFALLDDKGNLVLKDPKRFREIKPKGRPQP